MPKNRALESYGPATEGYTKLPLTAPLTEATARARRAMSLNCMMVVKIPHDRTKEGFVCVTLHCAEKDKVDRVRHRSDPTDPKAI